MGKERKMTIDCLDLKNEIIKRLELINGQEALKDRLWKEMIHAEDYGGSGRRGLVSILRTANMTVRHQAELPQVTEAWNEALLAASSFVKTENAKGRMGQKLFDTAFSVRFASMQSRVSGFPNSSELTADVVADLNTLTFEVNNYVWNGGFCKCGEPIPPKWRFCPAHYTKLQATAISTIIVAPTAPAGRRKKAVRHAEARKRRLDAGGPVGAIGRKKGSEKKK
jgi:hypothetical protein